MAYYRVPMVSVGPSPYVKGRDRTEPLGLSDGGHCIVLNDDEAILWVPNSLSDVRAVKIADEAGERTSETARMQFSDLRRDAKEIPVEWAAALADLLIDTGGKWNPIVPRRSGVLEVRLGPGTDNVIWSQNVIGRPKHSKAFADTFNRTAGNLGGSSLSGPGDSATWVEDQGTGWTTDGTDASAVGNIGFCVGRVSVACDTADMFAEGDITDITKNVGDNAAAFGVVVRSDATPTSGYSFECGQYSGSNERRLYNFVTDATLASDSTLTDSGTIYLEFDGSSYSCEVAGTPIFTGTNTTFDGTVKGVGMACFVINHAGNIVLVDNFSAGDLGGGGGSTVPPISAYFRMMGMR